MAATVTSKVTSVNPVAAKPALMTGAPPFPPAERVTLANWQEPPFNRWAFQHVRELIPTARIARASAGQPRPLPRAERDVLGFRFRSQDRELTVAGILAGRGGLDVSARVEEIVPDLGGTSFEGATVQDLLDMRAGTRFDESYDNPEADVRTYERVYLWRPDDGRPRPEDALGYFATLANDEPHGGPFRYRSILTDVLAWVIERAAGARLHQLIARELWQPMGAEFDAEITVDSRGNAMADGGICATLRDAARFGQLYLHRGQREGTEVVPAWWVDDTVRGAPDGPDAFLAGGGLPPGYPAGPHYRNCWWVDDPRLP